MATGEPLQGGAGTFLVPSPLWGQDGPSRCHVSAWEGACHSLQPAPSVPEQMVLLAGGLPRGLGVLAGCASPCPSTSLGPRSQGNWIGPRWGRG